MPPGADEASLRKAAPRSAGAAAPSRITPPTPAATWAVTEATSPSSTGTTTVWAARRRTLQAETAAPVGQASNVAEVASGASPGTVALDAHPNTTKTTKAIAVAPPACR